MKNYLFTLFLAIFVGLYLFSHFGHQIRSSIAASPTPISDRLFKQFDLKNYDSKAYQFAKKIERGDTIYLRDAVTVSTLINQRFGDGITFLFHAVYSQNLSAIDALLNAGADITEVVLVFRTGLRLS